MIYQAIAFYVLSGVMIFAALGVVTSRNPVHSVLFLILAFLNAAGLFLLQGAEFLALLLVVVYVGAVAVLFLFVVMMLDIDFEELRRGAVRYVPIGLLVGIALLAELAIVLIAWQVAPEAAGAVAQPVPDLAEASNIRALGRILYTDYVFVFQAAGLILLVAMVGAIVLTLRERAGVKRQNVARQVGRRPEDAIEIRQVKPGEGI